MSALSPNLVAFAAPKTLALPAQATTPAPAPESVVVFGRESAGRVMAATVGPSGLDTRLQPHIGLNRVAFWAPNGAGNSANTSMGGFFGAPALTALPMDDSPFGRIRKGGVSTTTTTGNAVGLSTSAAYSLNTGFHVIGHFSPFLNGNTSFRRFFAGMGAAAPTNAALSNYAGIGAHADTAQNTLRMRGLNGVETDLGASFPANDPGAWYRLELFCPPGGTTIGWRIQNLLGTADASGEFTGAQLPTASTFMSIHTRIITATNQAQRMTIGTWTIETDL